jgi:hypothetical protein
MQSEEIRADSDFVESALSQQPIVKHDSQAILASLSQSGSEKINRESSGASKKIHDDDEDVIVHVESRPSSRLSNKSASRIRLDSAKIFPNPNERTNSELKASSRPSSNKSLSRRQSISSVRNSDSIMNNERINSATNRKSSIHDSKSNASPPHSRPSSRTK